MSYTALYRKLRPHFFKDLIGQTHIVSTLQNQILHERISHAYLFCGTRGTGKTSAAKIFSRAINCENLQDGEPCDVCNSCDAIKSGRSMNVLEIDAASNNGVDNIRDIRDEVQYAPTEGKYRIYIVDEVHMLSTAAFNALLKTLEEPPEYVVFILATTDPQKIPATVLSRVQRFDFKRITTNDMIETMKKYMKDEKFTVDDDALSYIAGLSDGAMRDALSLLDQCIAFYYGQDLTLAKVLDIVGAVDDSVFFHFTDAIFARDVQLCMNLINEIIINGRDVNQFVNQLILHLRNLLMSINLNLESIALNLSKETIANLKIQGGNISQTLIVEYIKEFSKLSGEMKYAKNERVLLEVLCLKLCTNSTVEAENRPQLTQEIRQPQTSTNEKQMLERIAKLEALLANGAVASLPNSKANETVTLKPVAEIAPINKAIPTDIKEVIAKWKVVYNSFAMPLRKYLQMATPCYIDGETIYIVSEINSAVQLLKEKEQQILDKLTEMFGKTFSLAFVEKSEYDSRHMKEYKQIDKSFVSKEYTDVFGNDVNFEG